MDISASFNKIIHNAEIALVSASHEVLLGQITIAAQAIVDSWQDITERIKRWKSKVTLKERVGHLK